jgi:hypothetical protein
MHRSSTLTHSPTEGMKFHYGSLKTSHETSIFTSLHQVSGASRHSIGAGISGPGCAWRAKALSGCSPIAVYIAG